MIYVDQFPGKGWGEWNGGGHMLCTDLNELHEMAKQIGLRRSWFQDKGYPHYDVTRSKRALAVAAGAVEIEWGQLPDDVLVHTDAGYVTEGSQRC
jgi:hypothetical protein